MAKPLMWEFVKGLIAENPTFRIVLGLCPTLAISTAVDNAIAMGIAATIVLLGSEIIIAMFRKAIPNKIRMPVYIIIIATFVTIVALFIKAFSPEMDRALGIYLPLIVVNCIIFGRVEAFSSKNPVIRSLLDALGMGLGFTFALILISAIRELLGTMKISIFGHTLLALPLQPVIVFILAPGALLVMGLLLGFFALLGNKKAEKMGCCGDD